MCDAAPDLARSHRSDGGKQIKSRRHWRGGEDTFAISASSVRHLRRRGETAAIAAKVHRARGVEGDQHGGRLLLASPPIHSADLYDTLVHFNFTLPLLLLLPASKKRMPSPEGKSERERERVNSLKKRARDGEMEREGGAGREGGGVQFQHKM